MKGQDIYKIIKRNNTAVWAITSFCVIVSLGSMYFGYALFKSGTKNTYAINEKGELLPLKRLSEQEDRLIELKANMDYFVNLYYDLDAYNMKEKKEKVVWLLGTKPIEIFKDRDRKGYFNTFLSIAELKQHARLLTKSWKIINKTSPYIVQFEIEIVRINGESKEYYTCLVNAKAEDVNRNYPYNPFGFVITDFSENLSKIKEVVKENETEDINLINQNEVEDKNLITPNNP